jgi:hypothetical protein
MSLERARRRIQKGTAANRMFKKLLVFPAKCKYPVMSALVERSFRLRKCFHLSPGTMSRAGHSSKSSVVAGSPSGFSYTHGHAPANNPGTACTAQAHGSVLPWACGSRRAARSDACHIRGTALRDKVPSVQRAAQCRRRLRRPTEAQHALVPRFTGRAYRPPCGARSAAARTDAPTAIKLMLTKGLQAVARVSPTGDEHP